MPLIFYCILPLPKKRHAVSFHASSLAAFLLHEGGAREKLPKENAAKGISPSADGEEGTRPPLRELLKKLDQNVYKEFV